MSPSIELYHSKVKVGGSKEFDNFNYEMHEMEGEGQSKFILFFFFIGFEFTSKFYKGLVKKVEMANMREGSVWGRVEGEDTGNDDSFDEC